MSMAADEPEPEAPDFKHEPGTPGKDGRVDEYQSIRVTRAYQKVMETQRVTIEWMTGELGNGINQAMHAAFTSLQMQMMREGLDPKAAEDLAQRQILLMAFELGRLVGVEEAGADVLRGMLGDDFGKDFDL